MVKNNFKAGIFFKRSHLMMLHRGRNKVTPDKIYKSQNVLYYNQKFSCEKKNLYIYLLEIHTYSVDCDTSRRLFLLPSTLSCSSVWFRLWKRQCFMAIKGRSHMCISCCTNIVQCCAWIEANRGGKQAVVHEQLIASYSSISVVWSGLSNKHRPVCLWIKLKNKKEEEEMAPFCSRL